jgi:hypothetical protein
VQTTRPYSRPPANAPRYGLEISGTSDMQEISLRVYYSKYEMNAFKSCIYFYVNACCFL